MTAAPQPPKAAAQPLIDRHAAGSARVPSPLRGWETEDACATASGSATNPSRLIRHSSFAIRYSLFVLPLLPACGPAAITADLAWFPPPPAAPHAVHLKSFNRLHELVAARPSLGDLLRGRAAGPWIDKPAGIAHQQSHLYVCDTGAGAVHDWNLTDGTSRWIGTDGPGRLAEPVAVAVDRRGGLFVADTQRSEIVAFDAEGRFRRRLRPPDRPGYRPVALAVAQDRLYAADIAAHRVDIFATADGRPLGGFGEIGDRPGAFYYPMGLAFDTRGRLLLSDMMNARVQAFALDPPPDAGPVNAPPADAPSRPDARTPSEAANNPPEARPARAVLPRSPRVVLTFGRPGNRYGDMGKPRGLAVGPDGVIFVADAEFERVHLFDEKGRLLMLLGGSEDAPGSTPMPVGLAVARRLPESLTRLAPADFHADYYLFVSNTVGLRRLGLFAIGTSRASIPGGG